MRFCPESRHLNTEKAFTGQGHRFKQFHLHLWELCGKIETLRGVFYHCGKCPQSERRGLVFKLGKEEVCGVEDCLI